MRKNAVIFDTRPAKTQHSAGDSDPSVIELRPAGAGTRSGWPKPPISSFASLGGFVIRCPSRTLRFRSFLGSSAVEHSTVNRMVAGSNPARGANKTGHFLHFQ